MNKKMMIEIAITMTAMVIGSACDEGGADALASSEERSEERSNQSSERESSEVTEMPPLAKRMGHPGLDTTDKNPASRTTGAKKANDEESVSPDSEAESAETEPAETEPEESARELERAERPIPKVARDIVVEMPNLYEEVVGVSCPGANGSGYLRKDGAFLFMKRSSIVSCDGDEWRPFSSRSRGIWAMDHDGNMYASWTRKQPTVGTLEIVVSKMDPSGSQLWEKTVSTGKTRVAPAFVIASPAGVYVGGSSSGQLPGNPPHANGGAWIVRYDDGGEFQWVRQEQGEVIESRVIGETRLNHQAVVMSATVDGSDNLYLRYGSNRGHVAVQKLNTHGEREWLTFHAGSRCSGSEMSVSSDGDALFYDGGGSDGACITKLDGKGKLLWSNTYSPRHSVVIDAVEGTRWRGKGQRWHRSQATKSRFSLAKDSLVLVGVYENGFEHGSSPPPEYLSAWVATLDLDGEVLSSRNLRVGPLDVGPGESGSSVSFTPSNSGLLANGDLRIVGTRSGGSGGGGE